MTETKKEINQILEKFNAGKINESFEEIENLIKSNKNIEVILTHGLIAKKLNFIEKAKNSFEYVISKEPNNILSLHNLYSIAINEHNLDYALILTEKIIKFDSTHYEAQRDKAYILFLRKDFKNALKLIQKVIKINNKDVFSTNILGLCLYSMNEIKKAINVFKQGIEINKNYSDSYNNLGKCYFDLENLDNAFKYFKLAFKINPESYLAISNLGNILSLKDKNLLAIKYYKKALKLNQNNVWLYSNIAIAYCRLKNYANAKKAYDYAKKISPDDHKLHLSFAYLLISNKEYRKAWGLFDSRLHMPNVKKKNLYNDIIIKKLVLDKKIEKNDKLLILREQGIGDEILFSTMYKDLINRYANVKFETDPRLVKIFERSFDKKIFYPYGFFSSNQQNINKFDKIFYAGSLTKYLRNNEEDFSKKPILISNKTINLEIKRNFDQFKNKLKIGVSWKSIVNIYGSLKSLKLNDFKPIFKDNRQLINLQYGDVANEIKGHNIYTFNEINLYNDLDACLSILSNLDIFVTVSNTTAHLAGALGVPTIVICPKKSSTFYYWDYDNGVTPWYNSIKVVKLKDSISKTMQNINKIIDNL